MRLLLTYLKPYKWLLALALFLAAINQVFSLLDPYFFGKMFQEFGVHGHDKGYYDSQNNFIKTGERTRSEFIWGVMGYLGILVSVAMISRIAKAFQDYFGNVIVQKFGAKLFTDGLRHSLRLPFQEFEDQRSGETLSILTKVRTDTEKFIVSFINILFGLLVGVIFVSVYSFTLHWSIMPVYFGGIVLLSLLTGFLSKKVKLIQKTIVKETTSLAGSTTESLRNIELVKSLGLTNQEVKRLNNNTYKILVLELKKVRFIRSLGFIQGTTVHLMRSALMFALYAFVFHDIIKIGDLITLMFFSFFIFNPMQELGNAITVYNETRVSMDNFESLMNAKSEPVPVHPAVLGAVKELEFNKVTFKHQTVAAYAVKDISFKIKAGETVAFVGPSGSGKTTLVKLLVEIGRAHV